MLEIKKENKKAKSKLHTRNRHINRYNFKELINTCPELAKFLKINKYNDQSIDFSNAQAVKMLNKALLMHYYDIEYWDIPKGYLCPPIPGRADYIHYLADLLSIYNNGTIPTGSKIKCLDIGVGANCIYPIIGNKEYGWSFIGTDVEPASIKNASKIVELNSSLNDNVKLRLQDNPSNIFHSIIKESEKFDLTICNPPFHSSLVEANKGTMRKLSNLKGKKNREVSLNFGGKNSELWCNGGEKKFIENMIIQSKEISSSCLWFTTLVSKESNLKNIYKLLHKVEAIETKTIQMEQGNKTSRIVAWSFLTPKQQKQWMFSNA